MLLKSKSIIRHFSKFKRPPSYYINSKIKYPTPEHPMVENHPSFFVSPNFNDKLDKNNKQEDWGKNLYKGKYGNSIYEPDKIFGKEDKKE
jgi:hypothetical protein